MLRTPLLVAAVAVAAALTATFTASSADKTTPIVRRVQTTHMGKTAIQWQRIALKRRLAQDWLQHKLTARVLEVRALHHAIRRLSSHDTVLTSPLERNFLCIHGYEGSWTDPNAPFYGGLQMDDSFQRTYGPEFYKAWGSADHWPVSVQIAVAIKAYLSRGYHPWPNTARFCGLL